MSSLFRSEYGIRGQNENYTGTMWTGIAGIINMDFASDLEEEHSELFNYFNCTQNGNDYLIMPLDPVTGDPIDFVHMSATLNRLLYTGITAYSGIPTFGMLEGVADDLSGWAGDYLSSILEYLSYYGTTGTDAEIMNRYTSMLGNNNSCFPTEDILADIDACNLHQIISLATTFNSSDDIYALFGSYYGINSNNCYSLYRFTTWIGEETTPLQLKSRFSTYSNIAYVEAFNLSIGTRVSSIIIVSFSNYELFSECMTSYLFEMKDNEIV